MKQNPKTVKKLLYSLYAAGIVAGASALSGCATRTVYVYPDGSTLYQPSYTPAQSNNSQVPWQILSGVLQGLSGL